MPVHKRKETVVPSLEDRLQAEATEKAAFAIRDRFKTYLDQNPALQIRQLRIEHLRHLAGDAISAWVLERHRQEMNDPVDDIGDNIFA